MKEVPIDSVIGCAIGGGWGLDRPTSDSEEVIVLRGADFPSAWVQSLEGAPVRHEVAAKVRKRQLRAGDIVLEISGGTKDRPTGRTVLISDRLLSQTHHPIIPASFCRLVRIDDAKASPKFIYYVLQNLFHEGGTWEYQNQSTGLSNFQFELFRSKFNYPDFPLTQQRAIGEVLGALDDKIAANIKLVRTADQLAGTLTRASLSDELTTTLSDVAMITMGSSPPGSSYNEEGRGVIFYQGVRDFGVRYPINRVWTDAPVRMAEPNDCLLSVRAPVGQLNLASEATCIGRGLASVRSKSDRPMSLFHMLRDAPEIWIPYEAEGTVFGSINRGQLAALPVPDVRPDREEALELELAALEGRIANALRQSTTLAATRDALLPQLMSGKIRVKDAKVMAGEVL